ncbi:envelope stress response membrane protein PspB [Vibrio sp. WXL103]|uniref:envelope stress response membrane protein PspB n=1 Tax=unclassified Vibrio TaxID=2614977 RepID=UPI0030DF3F6F
MSSFFISAPLVLFMIFVAPLWLFLHYRSKKHTAEGLSSDDLEQLQQLSHRADKLKQRVSYLERVLDSETPEWRRRYDA